MKRIIHYIKRHKKRSVIVLILLIAYYFCLPRQLFDDPTSTVVQSVEGELLGAKIATDGQWRFPASDSIPEKFKQCILYFEDQHFYKHPGFNPVSIFNAMQQNAKAGKVVRGGSTLTQQVIRLSRKGKERTYFEKLIEVILATRLEFRSSKDDILKLYASHAPFGGNVVGLDMASWRYFGVQPHQLSWAESATLAVLPNAPSLIFPGKNKERLQAKRDRLLKKLHDEGVIDQISYELAVAEDLPQKPFPLPQIAPHLVERMAKTHTGERITTSIPYHTQNNVNRIVSTYHNIFKQGGVHNMAVLVLDVETREVLSYVGNSPTDKEHEKDVDIIISARSTGSILKPFLYAAMLDSGELLPDALVADIPTSIAGYSPKNFSESYDGAVPAKRALARSLNVPAIRLLQSYSLQKFREQLKYFDLNDIDRSADHYGLSLILGGAESSLWDLCKSYANLASTLHHFNETSSEYFTQEFRSPSFFRQAEVDFGERTQEKPLFDAGSIYLTFEAMKDVNRPEGDEAWEFYDSSIKVAWKTGTSFGNRDAWAIGVTKDHVVGVWVGNADGEGKPGLTGVTAAAPILFDVFDILPHSEWFKPPYDELIEVEVCEDSGYLATAICPKKTQWVPAVGTRADACSFHQTVHLDSNLQYRINTSCSPIDEMVTQSWFVLPPTMEYYFKNSNVTYRSLPPYRSDCLGSETTSMEFIFPKGPSKVFLPKDFEGDTNELVLKLAHTQPDTTVFWYLNDLYMGTTQTFHEFAILPEAGIHTITVVDEFGNEVVQTIEVRK